MQIIINDIEENDTYRLWHQIHSVPQRLRGIVQGGEDWRLKSICLISKGKNI